MGNMYIDLSRTLDTAGGSLDTSRSREVFGDVVTFGTDSLYVQSDFTITKYDVNDALKWIEAGSTATSAWSGILSRSRSAL